MEFGWDNYLDEKIHSLHTKGAACKKFLSETA